MRKSRFKQGRTMSPVDMAKLPKWYRRRLERDRYYTQAIDPSDLVKSPSPPSVSSLTSNMATTAGGNKLAQEIHEEFLTCKICLEGFKQPKSLECLHTFCENCIDNHVLNECSYKKYSDYREFTCPLCRKRTQLPIGGVKKLPDNFLVASLSEVIARQKPSKFPYCDICKMINRKTREATSKCIDCNKLLCRQCIDIHRDTKVTMNHSLFDVEIEKDIECKEHEGESVRYYCEPCQTCICILCTFNEHKDHEITNFSDSVTKYKENINDLLSNCKGKIDVYDRQLGLLSKCELVIKTVEKKIRDAAAQYIADINAKEKALIEELHSMYGSELMEYVNRKNEMQTNLDGLKSTCSLTEMVLKGKDIELLLLKKQVQDKLTVMANVELKDLPNSVGQHVDFVEGSVNLGRLEDPDKPLEKRPIEEIKNEEPKIEEKRMPKIIRQNKSNNRLPNMTFRRRADFDSDFEDASEKDASEKDASEKDTSEKEEKDDKTEKEEVKENIIKVEAIVVPKSTQSTQTDRNVSSGVKTVGRCVQTEFYIPENGYQAWKDPFSDARNRVSSSVETKATETETRSSCDKSSNTRTSRILAARGTGTSIDESPPTTIAESSSGMDATCSPAPRRRRRRERPKPVEVQVRPTTNYQSSEGWGTFLSDKMPALPKKPVIPEYKTFEQFDPFEYDDEW